MAGTLEGKRVAILATDGFEQVELTSPRRALADRGSTVHVIGPKRGQIRAWKHAEWGDSVDVDRTLGDARPEDYDALVLPGGVMNPDKLRMNRDAIAFVRAFCEANKPVAAICHGPWTLIDAEVVKGRRMTSYPSLRKDLENAGARWVDEQVVVDANLITSRNPHDLPAFEDALVSALQSSPRARDREVRA